MTQNTLYWHDYETFGIDTARDRPVQFAGIRTDEDLNIIGEPLNIMARPAPDSLPHPMSSLITGITPQQALEQGLPEAEFIAVSWRSYRSRALVGWVTTRCASMTR